jgi:general secretion pathway protein G
MTQTIRQYAKQHPHSYAALFTKGFTIIELLVVMAILGILSLAVMPLSEMLVTSQKERELKRALWEIRGAIDEYKKVVTSVDNAVPNSASGYPPNLQTLVDGITHPKPEAGGRHVYFLRTLPRDPFADKVLPADKTWRLRSFTSPAENPQPGSEVFDVHSSSDDTALDGSLYAKW